MRIGWKGLKRIYYTVLHFDIKDGRIWLQQNTTDIDVGEELLGAIVVLLLVTNQ